MAERKIPLWVKGANWLWRPFETEQTLLSPAAYFALAMVAYPLVLYLPTHLVLARWSGPAERGP